MATEVKKEIKEIKEIKENQTIKILFLTDLKANKSQEMLDYVANYDVVILRTKKGDVRLSAVTYS